LLALLVSFAAKTMRSIEHSAPLRIVAVSPVYWPCVGGGERLLGGILEQLVQRGHHAKVVTVDAARLPDLFVGSGSGLPQQDQHNGVEILRLPRRGGGLAGKAARLMVKPRGVYRILDALSGGLAELACAMPSPLAFYGPMRTAEADVVITANWFSGVSIMGTLVAHHRRIPVVGLPLLHTFQPWSQRRLLRWAAPRSDCAVALTPSEAEHLRGLGTPRTAVIGGSVPADWGNAADPAALRRRLGIGSEPVVGFVGRQDEGKGTPALIAAMRLVWRNHPEARLLLAGPAAHRDAATQAALAAIGPNERQNVVEVHDFSDAEAPAMFGACDLLAQPSVEESFGLVLIEAWKMGRPVIGADIPATRDLISDGEDGLIVPPADPPALADAIVRLLGSESTRTLMGERGRAKVMEHYTTETMIDAWESLLLDVVAASGRRPEAS
jgi:glycosyltransferase involved in cell wall biosynthesis